MRRLILRWAPGMSSGMFSDVTIHNVLILVIFMLFMFEILDSFGDDDHNGGGYSSGGGHSGGGYGSSGGRHGGYGSGGHHYDNGCVESDGCW